MEFDPSAWYANERHGYWQTTAPAEQADYSRLFLRFVNAKEIRVTLHEILEGLSPGDHRLRDELIAFTTDGA